ncbi:MAG: PIN domain-containing protein [Thermoguttaceae bacterium]|jgi:predicted nucleic acid-binding protein
MNRVFADTSYYIALVGDHDQHHAEAVALAQVFHGLIVTTDFVLVEVGNWLSQVGDRPVFLRLLEAVGADAQTEILPATRDLFDAGCVLFARRTDKNWSLTDCVSFAVMHQQGLAEAFTADHHFEQAGFKALLR